MKRYFISLSLILLITVLFFSCPEGLSISAGTRYAIGDIGPSGVGIVFHVTDGGLHGLEAAPADQSLSKEWSNVKATIGTTQSSIGTGLGNSNAIITQSTHNSSAAKVCRDYTGGDMTDWFLPSIDELAALYERNTSVGNFALAAYWSSTEHNELNAEYLSFANGNQGSGNKSSLQHVRAVRVF